MNSSRVTFRPCTRTHIFEDKPRANARISLIPRGQCLAERFDDQFELRTDDQGIAELTPSEANLYLIAVHHHETQHSTEGNLQSA